jgi:hypothetical protein
LIVTAEDTEGHRGLPEIEKPKNNQFRPAVAVAAEEGNLLELSSASSASSVVKGFVFTIEDAEGKEDAPW